MHEYDPTAGVVDTPPHGTGKYIRHENGKVVLEMDCMYAVEFPAEKCFIEGGSD